MATPETMSRRRAEQVLAAMRAAPAESKELRRKLLDALADPQVALLAVELLAAEHRRALAGLRESQELLERFRNAGPAGRLATVVGGSPESGLLEVVPHGCTERRLVHADSEVARRATVGACVRIAEGQDPAVTLESEPGALTGRIGIVRRAIDGDRLLVSHGDLELILTRSAALDGQALAAGDEVRFDPLCEVVHETLPRPAHPHYLSVLAFPGTPVAPLAREALPAALGVTVWELCRTLIEPQVLVRHGVQAPPRSLLLTGVPGCGKTESVRLLTRTLAGEHGSGRALLVQPITGRLLSKYYGSTERLLETMVDSVERLATASESPLVFFIDEIDGLARGRGEAGNAVGDRILTSLLGALDRLRDCPGVLLVAATNRPDLVDGAALRRQRFDRVLEFGRPGEAGTAAILERHLPAAVPTEPARSKLIHAAQVGLFSQPRLGRIHLVGAEPPDLLPRHLLSGALLAGAVQEALSRRAYRVEVAGEQGPLLTRELVRTVLRLTAEAAEQLSPANAAARLPDLVGSHQVSQIALERGRKRPPEEN